MEQNQKHHQEQTQKQAEEVATKKREEEQHKNGERTQKAQAEQQEKGAAARREQEQKGLERQEHTEKATRERTEKQKAEANQKAQEKQAKSADEARQKAAEQTKKKQEQTQKASNKEHETKAAEQRDKGNKKEQDAKRENQAKKDKAAEQRNKQGEQSQKNEQRIKANSKDARSSWEAMAQPGKFITAAWRGDAYLVAYNDWARFHPLKASFKMVPGLTNPSDASLFSFEHVEAPHNFYLRHAGFVLHLHQNDGSDLFKKDATFKKVPGLADNGQRAGVSFESVNYPGNFIMNNNGVLRISRNDGSPAFKNAATFIRRPALVDNNGVQVWNNAKANSMNTEGVHCACREMNMQWITPGWKLCPGDMLWTGVRRNHIDLLAGMTGYKCCKPCRPNGQALAIGGCYNANWWGSFDRPGWSHCMNGGYIQGFLKNSCPWIYCLEEARCCHIQGSRGRKACNEKNWWGSLDRPGWSYLDNNRFATGLFRTGQHYLHNIEMPLQCSFYAF